MTPMGLSGGEEDLPTLFPLVLLCILKCLIFLQKIGGKICSFLLKLTQSLMVCKVLDVYLLACSDVL